MVESDFVITKILFLIMVVFLFYFLFYLSRKTKTQKITLVLLTIQLSISLLRYQQFGLSQQQLLEARSRSNREIWIYE